MDAPAANADEGFLAIAIALVICLANVFKAVLWRIITAIFPSLISRKSVVGDVVLITGSGSGIGRGLAIKFGELGARVVLWDVNSEGNGETKKMLEEAGVKAYAYTVDLCNRASIYETAEKVRSEVGNVTILINNAGIVAGKKLTESTDEMIEKVFAVNTLSHFHTTKAFLPSMLDANYGHIVEIASLAGKAGTALLTDYCASKHAVVGFAKALKSELRSMEKDGIIVTTICPFFIDTGMFKGVKPRSVALPILEPDYVVNETVDAILKNRDVLYLPTICQIVVILQSLLPFGAIRALEDFYGSHKSMDSFIGRT